MFLVRVERSQMVTKIEPNNSIKQLNITHGIFNSLLRTSATFFSAVSFEKIQYPVLVINFQTVKKCIPAFNVIVTKHGFTIWFACAKYVTLRLTPFIGAALVWQETSWSLFSVSIEHLGFAVTNDCKSED